MNLKKKLLLLCAIGASAFTASNIQAQGFSLEDEDMFGAWYFAGTGSINWRNDDSFPTLNREYNMGYGATGALGIHLYNNFRAEAEVGYKRQDLDRATSAVTTTSPNGHACDLTVMGNIFYDIPLDCCFSLYIGAGAGVSFYELEAGANKSDGTVFAWQVMPGVAYNITDCFAITTGYRFFSTAKVKSQAGASTKDNPIVHNVELGFRFSF